MLSIVRILGVLLLLFLADRLLLRLELKGRINYRRRGLSRSGFAFHTITLHTIFNPGAENIIKAKYEEEKHQDESGEPE